MLVWCHLINYIASCTFLCYFRRCRTTLKKIQQHPLSCPPATTSVFPNSMSATHRRPTVIIDEGLGISNAGISPPSATSSGPLPLPPNPTRPRFTLVQLALILLFLTSLIGTLYASYSTSTDVLSVRSRLPSSLTPAPAFSATPPLALNHRVARAVGGGYFANKRNIFNRVFVKQGWAWTSLVTFIYLATVYLDGNHKSKPGPPASSGQAEKVDKNEVWEGFRKWGLATVYWSYLTQSTWFIFFSGPSVSHHILTATGAQCMRAAANVADGKGGNAEFVVVEGKVQDCKGSEGMYWDGGHDVSGHTFLLIHASLLLVTLTTPSLIRLPSSMKYHYNSIFAPSTSSSSTRPTGIMSGSQTAATLLAVALVGLWWWMLLMTSIHFHTPGEKFTGFLFALAGWYLTAN